MIGSTAFDSRGIYGPNTQAGEMWSLDHGGAPRWLSSDGGPFHFGAVSVANGVVYSNDLSGFLSARDALTGAPHPPRRALVGGRLDRRRLRLHSHRHGRHPGLHRRAAAALISASPQAA